MFQLKHSFISLDQRMRNSAYGVILHVFSFKIKLFKIFFSGTPSEYQTVWIQSRPDLLSGLIWVQTVCKSYRQTATLVGNASSQSCMHSYAVVLDFKFSYVAFTYMYSCYGCHERIECTVESAQARLSFRWSQYVS